MSGDERAYRGILSWIKTVINIMPVWGIGMRDVNVALKISAAKALKALKSGEYQIKPKRSQCDCVETDEFWTYEEGKRTKCGLFTHSVGEAGESRRMSGGYSRRRKS
ncbi:MAG: hypothetical protein LBL45_07350 [Treponema sp.]|jgi:hypothetical protein|nr:hypothetical protein [Treponema sp.]